ncbi:LysR family transcriptional regulator [Paenibacillus hunanensis]|uniref:LysR substrate-binding domain-containing protein n=1 Tax=Paenibacillus hunanensis TaxID=539262 RepID=UPI002A6B8FDB|nr:LysR family transcriptional regulator [Paenibacillus hunanensis]WPP40076.1 LysR family transcriptional regulator [Paenibacillus hunanensis]
MDLKELTTFRTVIQEGTFSRAADKLHYAQSTVTHQIQRLEKELGIQLFKRGWDAELTEAGKIYAVEVDSLMAHWQHVRDQAQQLQQEERGILRVGMIESICTTWLPTVMSRFAEQKPRIQYELTVGNTDTLTQMLIERQIELALCGEPTKLDLLHFEPLYTERIAFIVHEQHPLAHRSQLTQDDLQQYPLAVGGRSCLYHLRLEKEFSRLKLQPFMHSISQLSAVPALAKATGSIGVVLDSTFIDKQMVKLEFPLAEPYLNIGLLMLREQSYLPLSRQLLMNIVREEAIQ